MILFVLWYNYVADEGRREVETRIGLRRALRAMLLDEYEMRFAKLGARN